MGTGFRLAAQSALLTCAVALGVACANNSGSAENGDGGGGSPGSNRQPSVSGTVSYNERLALTPGATLIIELRDTSYADAPSEPIASETVTGPGQVPIRFGLPYDPDDIDPGNRYSVSARIMESDGRLAFTNDTAYDVLTHGNPNRVDMLLVLVEPPPDLLESINGSGEDWRAWREVPAQVIWANLIPNEPVPLLRVAYYQSTLENCARPGNRKLAVDGRDISVRLTLMQPPETPWAAPCHEELVELDTVLHVGASLTPGAAYRVIVNGVETTSFTVPETRLNPAVIDRSPIRSAEVVTSGPGAGRQVLRVASGLPKGSGCSQFNGYEIRRNAPRQWDVIVTHHEIADPLVVCTADFPIIETDVPLGPDLVTGSRYTINVNGDRSVGFVAR